jgi:hypothetical protein
MTVNRNKPFAGVTPLLRNAVEILLDAQNVARSNGGQATARQIDELVRSTLAVIADVKAAQHEVERA